MGLLNNNFVKVGLGLCIGLAIIIYFNPPSTPCSAQIEIYDGDLLKLIGDFNKAKDNCKNHPEPGGCLGFFDVLNKIEAHFNTVSRQCQLELVKDSNTRNWLRMSMELLARLAWGSKPPDSYLYRNGWLELTQVVEFCRLRKHLETIYGDGEWSGFVNDLMPDLPGAEILMTSGSNEVWNRSLMSDPCHYVF